MDRLQHYLSQFSSCMMEYEATIPSRYMLGSTLGTVLACSRKAKEPQETILNTYRAHHGPVRALQRNPLFPKNFLTAGDRSMKVACIYNIYSIYNIYNIYSIYNIYNIYNLAADLV